MTNQGKQERPATIDANGNIIPKPYGASRWAAPRIRQCAHDECTNPAKILQISDSIEKAHNCCTEHEGGAQ